MGIKIKHRAPKSTDFSKNDIVINVKEGALYFKSELSNKCKRTCIRSFFP